MKCKNCQFNPKKRRGLSSVVGALLFVVLMVATFSVLGVALNTQTDIVSTARDVSDIDLKKQQEAFDLISINQPLSENLEVSLINRGQNAAEMFTLIMTNKSDSGEPTTTFNIPSETSFLAPGDDDPTDIVETINLILDIPALGDVERYEFKVVSSLGTIKKLIIDCNGDSKTCGPVVGPIGTGALSAQLFLDGPTGVNGKISTVIMFVQNTGDAPVYNLSPTKDCSAMTTPPVDGTFDPCLLTPTPPIPQLDAGAVAIFKWDGVLGCAIDDVFTFTNAVGGFEADLTTAVPDSIPEQFDTLTCIDPNDCGPGGCSPGGDGGETIILIDDLLIRPSIFMIIPSPMGDADDTNNDEDKVMFGVNVVNPTNSTIAVSKVIISVFAPGAQNNDKLFAVGGPLGCEAEDLSSFVRPNNWSCPGENMLMWKNRDNPVSLPPYSVETFMTKMIIGTISGGGDLSDLEGVLIQTSVFTSFGSFGKGNYQTTMALAESATMSMYMSPIVDSLADADRLGNRDDITHNVTQNFNIVLADTGEEAINWLQAGARFIINVPREWSGVNVTGTTGILGSPTVEIFGDKSTQIIGITSGKIGKCTDTCAFGERRASTISFEVLPPNKEFDRLYIMYVLADGEVWTSGGYNFTAGPLNEIVLQVNSNSTGP